MKQPTTHEAQTQLGRREISARDHVMAPGDLLSLHRLALPCLPLDGAFGRRLGAIEQLTKANMQRLRASPG